MTRFLKAACAVMSILFGVLFAFCSATDLFTGANGVVGAVLGLAWATAGIVCGIETWRGPLVLARAIRQAMEGTGR
jgi:hypothetical protein